MQPTAIQQALRRLDALDDRLGYRIRPRAAGFSQPSVDQLVKKDEDLANYVLELKEILQELLAASGG